MEYALAITGLCKSYSLPKQLRTAITAFWFGSLEEACLAFKCYATSRFQCNQTGRCAHCYITTRRDYAKWDKPFYLESVANKRVKL